MLLFAARYFSTDGRCRSLLAAKMKAKAAIGGDRRSGDGVALDNILTKGKLVLSPEDLSSAFVRPLPLCSWTPEYVRQCCLRRPGGDRRRSTVARPIALPSQSANRLSRRLLRKYIRNALRALGFRTCTRRGWRRDFGPPAARHGGSIHLASTQL
jgi:hypothetical protein